MKFKIIIVLIFATTFCNAQSFKEQTFISGSYTYFNQNLGEIGVKYITNENGGFVLGANVLVGSANKKLLLIPELNATQYFTKTCPMTFVRLNVSPKTITPQLGVSLLFIEAGVGYGIPMGKSSLYNTQGFRASIIINIPLEFHMKLF